MINMKNRILIILSILSISTIMTGFLDPVYDLNKEGNTAYQKSKLDDAYGYYERALEIRHNHPKILYNLANTLYKAQNYSEANIKLKQALKNLEYLEDENEKKELKQKILYNTGNSFFKMGDMDKAIENYEKALKLNPEDEDTRFNLELAKKVKEMQEKQKQQQQKQQQEKQQRQQQNSSRDKSGKNNNQNEQEGKDRNQSNNPNSGQQNNSDRQDKKTTNPNQNQPGQNPETSQAKKDQQNTEFSESRIKRALNDYMRTERNTAKRYFQRMPKKQKNPFEMTTDELLREMQEEMGMIESNNNSQTKDW